MYVQAISGPVREKARRSANYTPSIWGDKFLAYQNSHPLKTDDADKHVQLREEVKTMLVGAADNPQKQTNIIDEIQRLGVSYHFEDEIDAALQHLNDIFDELCGSKYGSDSLHTISLCFRLLRQQGHNVSPDVFSKFKDEKGNFKEEMIKDVQGILSLYEATHYLTHGEDILEEALAFTTSHLENLKSHATKPLGELIAHVLELPIRKSLNRLEARFYISIYQQYDSHNKVLLDFAKLDFNLLQKMHQGEIAHIMRWWKDLDFANKLPFARDRVVECYFWILGVYFEPQYITARRMTTKMISLASTLDDIYDVYGTLEELFPFTDAIENCDISCKDLLPEYMRVCYQALLDVYDEMEKEMKKAGRQSYPVQYAKDSFARMVKAYLEEAKWYNKGYLPTVEEYMKVAEISAGYSMLACISFVGMGDVANKEAFQWVSDDPPVVIASGIVARLMDDIAGHEFEQEKGDVASAVECYMNQHGVSKEEAHAELTKQILSSWKDINHECLRQPPPVARPLLKRIINMTCILHILYDGDDGYTHSSPRIKKYITSLLIDPIPA